MATREGAAESDGDAGVGGVRRDGDGGGDGAAGRPAAPTSPYVIISFDIGVKNLACCVLALDHVPQATARPVGAPAVAPGASVLHWTVYSLAAEKERIPSVNELSGRLFMVLDEFVADLEARGIPTVEMVLLENQPSRLNGAMKSIQMMIYTYFQLRRHWEGRFLSVQMVSAGKKIQGHDCEIATPESCGYKPKKGYALNKWNAVQIAKAYVAEDADLATLFGGHKKKDDLADSLCQVLAWVRNHGYKLTCVRTDIKRVSQDN